MEHLRLVARNAVNTLNAATSKLRLKLLTDTGKPISKERLLVVTAEGKVTASRTDATGIADFTDLPAPPVSLVYVVLPEVLEGWSDDYRSQSDYPILGGIGQPAAQGEAGANPSPLSDHAAQASLLDLCRPLSKDAVVQIETGAASCHRGKDFSKHLALTHALDDGTVLELTVNRLTSPEKLAHFKDFLNANEVKYIAGKMNYDSAAHIFNFSLGAVCNQFGNLFLGFWFNYNSAFTSRGSASTFTEIMSNLTSSGGTYHSAFMRGYSDSCSKVSHPVGSTSQYGLDYIETDFHDPSVWDPATHAYVDAALMSALGEVNIYSVADKPHLLVDHHGGIMYKDAQAGGDGRPTVRLCKLTADGQPTTFFEYQNQWYELPSGSSEAQNVTCQYAALTGRAFNVDKDGHEYYSQKRIGDHPMDDATNMIRKNLHLGFWALKPLRPGGYAPGDDAGSYRSAAYAVPEPGAKPPPAIDTAATNFRLWLPRFIAWGGAVPATTLSTDQFKSSVTIGRNEAFLGFGAGAFDVAYEVGTIDKNGQVTATNAATLRLTANSAVLARQRFECAHPDSHKQQFTVTSVKRVGAPAGP